MQYISKKYLTLEAKTLKALLHYTLGLRFGNLKRSKTHGKTQLTRVFN